MGGRIKMRIKDGEILVISGGRVSIKPAKGRSLTMILNPDPNAQIKKTGAPIRPD